MIHSPARLPGGDHRGAQIMKKLFVFLFLSFGFVAVLGPVLAQIEETVQVDVIEIWAKVTDQQNRIVTDLEPEDFQIYIDGQKMENRCFDKTFENEPNSDKFFASPDLKRKFIFFFDMLNTPAQDVEFLKTKIIDFIRNSFREIDEGMVFVLLPTAQLGVVQKMTSDRAALNSVISKMKGNPSLQTRVRNNEKLLLQTLYTSDTSSMVASNSDSGRRNFRSPETFRQARSLAQTFATQEENLSRFTVSSFLGIANYLSGNRFEGRLVMIYFSGGFSIYPGQNYYEIVNRAIERELLTNSDMVFREHPDYDFQKETRKAIGILNRLNVTIYSVDSGGTIENDKGPERNVSEASRGSNAVAHAKELQDSLAIIAQETGGTALINTNNFQKGLSDIASDMGQQYWLCSTAPPGKKPGTYRKIEVKLARSDLQVRHRKGYVE